MLTVFPELSFWRMGASVRTARTAGRPIELSVWRMRESTSTGQTLVSLGHSWYTRFLQILWVTNCSRWSHFSYQEFRYTVSSSSSCGSWSRGSYGVWVSVGAWVCGCVGLPASGTDKVGLCAEAGWWDWVVGLGGGTGWWDWDNGPGM